MTNTIQEQINLLNTFNDIYDLKDNFYKLDDIDENDIISAAVDIASFEYLDTDMLELELPDETTNIIGLLKRDDNLLQAIEKAMDGAENTNNIKVWATGSVYDADYWDGGDFNDLTDVAWEWLSEYDLATLQEYLANELTEWEIVQSVK